jgi:hypothetical protein
MGIIGEEIALTRRDGGRGIGGGCGHAKDG